MPSTWLRNDWCPRNEIDSHVPDALAIGVFTLGADNGRGGFFVDLVGRATRAEGGVRGRLHTFDGAFRHCTAFKFDAFADEAEAFAAECRIFHTFQPMLNERHPEPPAGSALRCPIAGCGCE